MSAFDRTVLEKPENIKEISTLVSMACESLCKLNIFLEIVMFII